MARLAAFLVEHKRFQIALTKSYNDAAFFEDLRGLCIDAGQKNIPTAFLLTDLEIKNETFLEYINSFLSTGEVTGLFAKEERDGASILPKQTVIFGYIHC